MADVLHRRFVMRRLILNNYPSHKVESEVADSIDFMIERVSAAGLQGCATCTQHRMHTAPPSPPHGMIQRFFVFPSLYLSSKQRHSISLVNKQTPLFVLGFVLPPPAVLAVGHAVTEGARVAVDAQHGHRLCRTTTHRLTRH